jgi:hypothetical protein
MKPALVQSIPTDYSAERLTEKHTPEGVKTFAVLKDSVFGVLEGRILKQGDWVLTDREGRKHTVTDKYFRKHYEPIDPEAKGEIEQFGEEE